MNSIEVPGVRRNVTRVTEEASNCPTEMYTWQIGHLQLLFWKKDSTLVKKDDCKKNITVKILYAVNVRKI